MEFEGRAAGVFVGHQSNFDVVYTEDRREIGLIDELIVLQVMLPGAVHRGCRLAECKYFQSDSMVGRDWDTVGSRKQLSIVATRPKLTKKCDVYE